MQALLDQLTFQDWRFVLRTKNDVPYVQIRFDAPCTQTGDVAEQACRKWLLSYHMTDGEVLGTALKAVLSAVEHEAREQFLWRGQPIFRPHYDPQALLALCEAKAVQKRTPPASSST